MKVSTLRRSLKLAALMLLAVCALGIPQAHAEDKRCFPETNQCIEGRFQQFWEQNGGLAVFGFPITAPANEVNRDTGATYYTQWFERNRFELHPENAAPYDVLLGRLGADRLAQLGRNWQAEPRESGPKTGCLWFEATGHNVCNQSGTIGFKTYWETNGLKDPKLNRYGQSLALFGLPLTEPKMETNPNGDTVMTQWFERGRFEFHPGNSDQYKVLLGLLGREVRAGTNVQPTPAPTTAPVPTPTAAPANPCDGIPAPVDGRIRPTNCTREGARLTLDVFGFKPNEDIGFWITDPDGNILGTVRTVNIGPTGSVEGLTFSTEDMYPGLWYWVFQGTTSKHQSIVYFKIIE